MKWVLVVIMFNSYQPDITVSGVYDTIFECFAERQLVVDYDLEADEYNNPINGQALCIRVDDYILNIDETPPLQ